MPRPPAAATLRIGACSPGGEGPGPVAACREATTPRCALLANEYAARSNSSGTLSGAQGRPRWSRSLSRRAASRTSSKVHSSAGTRTSLCSWSPSSSPSGVREAREARKPASGSWGASASGRSYSVIFVSKAPSDAPPRGAAAVTAYAAAGEEAQGVVGGGGHYRVRDSGPAQIGGREAPRERTRGYCRADWRGPAQVVAGDAWWSGMKVEELAHAACMAVGIEPGRAGAALLLQSTCLVAQHGVPSKTGVGRPPKSSGSSSPAGGLRRCPASVLEAPVAAPAPWGTSAAPAEVPWVPVFGAILPGRALQPRVPGALLVATGIGGP